MIRKTWFKNPDDPSTPGQRKMIRMLLTAKNLTEMWLHKGTNKWINEMTMEEANTVIRKLSNLRKKTNEGKNNNQA